MHILQWLGVELEPTVVSSYGPSHKTKEGYLFPFPPPPLLHLFEREVTRAGQFSAKSHLPTRRDPPSIPNPCTPVRPPPLPCPSHIFTNSSVRHALISEITPHCPSTVHCPLSTVHWPLSTFHFPLTTVHFPLSTVHCPVFTVQCSLSTPHSPLPAVHSLSEL